MASALWSLIAALALLTTACSPRVVDRNDPAFREEGSRLYYGPRPFSGVAIERFPDGSPYKQTHYEQGLRDGMAEEYALTGKLRARWKFRRGEKDGHQEGWYIEGPKRFEANFKQGLLHGEQTEWHLNGQLFQRRVFAEGVETDKKILFPTAEVFSNYTKREGRVYGLDGGPLCFEPKKEGEK